MRSAFLIFVLLLTAVDISTSIWCYRCTSATPGCDDDFDWRVTGYLGEACPEPNDICVKVIERRGAQQQVTRECLSSLSFRTDIPADHYEGCRPAAQDVRLAHYVNHTTKEHDVRRDYYTNVTFCFCFLDHRCNNAELLGSSKLYILLSLILSLLTSFRML